MNHYLRNVLALIAAVCLAIPTPGGGGGENNGGTGVWILPACANVTLTSQDPNAVSRADTTLPNTSADVRLRVETSMSASSATFTDDLSGTVVGMQVSGRVVTIPKQLLQALQQSAIRKATVIISDVSQCGYVIRVSILSDGRVRLRVL